MDEHYIVVLDQGHLRIFSRSQPPGQSQPGLKEVEALDFPHGRESYVDRDTDMAGRFPGFGARGDRRQGGSIDERLPMQREEDRRRNRDVAEEVERFLLSHPNATWDVAIPAELNHLVIDQLSPPVRQRLRHTVPKDLVNQPVDKIREHFLRPAGS